MGERKQGMAHRSILSALVLLIFLPFLNKAFHIDDPVYVWVARHIQGHPFDFYGFPVNWYGINDSMSVINKNPPLFSYYLAGAGGLFGWSEIVMHMAALLPVIMLALGTYQLAGLMKVKPFPAALLTVCTPVFVLSGTAVMVDMAMTAFYVWAVYFWIRGLEKEGYNLLLAIAALLVAASGLTKYFGLSLLPLLSVYAIWQRTPVRRWLPFLVIPLGIFALYQWWTNQLYGAGLITDAANYAITTRKISLGTFKDAVLIGLSFTGGGILTPLVFAPMLLNRRGWAVSIGSLVLIAGMLLAVGSVGKHNTSESWLLFAQLAVFIVTGGGLLVLAAVELWREREAKTALMSCWVFGTFIFASLVNWSITGRNILPMAPAAGILIARTLERRGQIHDHYLRNSRFALTLVLTLTMALLVSYADYRYANEVRSLAQQVGRVPSYTGGRLLFQGHWGFQYYLEKEGAIPIDFVRTTFQAGDIVVTPSFNVKVYSTNNQYFEIVQDLYLRPLSWLSTHNYFIGAGFYTSKIGPLPYAFGVIRPEPYTVQILKITTLDAPLLFNLRLGGGWQ
jgi:4-amino-4-deoxy-L-arabinose transferase-like glycosyltransferase